MRTRPARCYCTGMPTGQLTGEVPSGRQRLAATPARREMMVSMCLTQAALIRHLPYAISLTRHRQATPMRKMATKLAAIFLMLGCAIAAAEAAEQSQGSAANANCQNTGSFDRWLSGFRQEAASNGISHATIAAALDGMTMDPGIIARDRRQSFFAQSFTAFAGKLISPNRIQ